MRTLLTIAMLAALGLTSACHDRVSPERTALTVSIAERSGPSITVDAAGYSTVLCRLTLKAAATGAGHATWQDAVYRVFIGPDLTTPVDSFVIAATDIAQAFGGSTIAAGESTMSTWDFQAGVPFSAEFEFRYRGSSQSATAHSTVAFACGSPPSSTAAPTITSITLSPPSGELPAGAPLNVHFEAYAPGGFFRSLVRVRGPCAADVERVENLTTSISRTVVVAIPGTCPLGVPIEVTVSVMDGAGRTATQTVSSSLVLADHEPPSINPRFFPPNGGSAQTLLHGDYRAGDSIAVIPNAFDTHALAAIVWEVLPYGAKDSVIVYSNSVPSMIHVKLAPTWSGPIQLRLWARDGVGLMSPVYTSLPDSVRVIPAPPPPP